ncbi:MAG: NfeD family protein [Phycisphaerales bacterium]
MLRGLVMVVFAAMLAISAATAFAQTPSSSTSTPTVTPPSAVPAGRFAQNVALIRLDTNSLDDVDEKSVLRRIDLAQASGAGAIVIELDSTGGDIGPCMTIARAIRECSLPVTAWVRGDVRGNAVLIVLACSRIIFAPDAHLGGAGPPGFALFGRQTVLGSPNALDLVLVGLTESARKNGWDEKLVQGFAATGVQMWMLERASTTSGGGTPQRRLADRTEVKLVLGTDPPSVPVLVKCEGIPAELTIRGPSRGNRRGSVARPPPPGSPGRVPVADALRFQPATSAINPVLVETISRDLTVPTTRQPFTLADRDAWTVALQASDGNGLLRINAAQAAKLGLCETQAADAEQVKTYFGASQIVAASPLWYETLAKVLGNPWLRGLIIVVFLVTLFLEFVLPGSVLPGSIAAVALVLLLLPNLLMGLSAWWPPVAIVAGICLLALEMFVLPSFGVVGIIGILAIFGGLIGSFTTSASGGLFGGVTDSRELWVSLTVVALSTLLAGGVIFMIARHLPSLPGFQRFVLSGAGEDDPVPSDEDSPLDALSVGMTGVAITPLRPSGRAEFDGQTHDVVCDGGFVAPGSAVRITEISPFRVSVEPA